MNPYQLGKDRFVPLLSTLAVLMAGTGALGQPETWRPRNCLSVLSQSWSAQQSRNVDKVRATKSIKGRFIGFEFGDYTHAVIRRPNGRTQSFFLFEPGMEYFLAVHKGQPLEFAYQVVDTHLEEAGNIRIERLTSAKGSKVNYEQWWKRISARYSMEELERRYRSLIDKYELK
jgi:hypothetical protein